MSEETPKPRKPRSDKGIKRVARVFAEPERYVPPVLAVVDGEEILCDSYLIENGFLKLRYWAQGRGRVGTRIIRLEAVRDVSIEEPQQMQQQTAAPVVHMIPASSSPTIAATQPTGPVEEVNPLVQARKDPKANVGVRVPDPVGMRPMSRIVDENGKVSIVEAGMQ